MKAVSRIVIRTYMSQKLKNEKISKQTLFQRERIHVNRIILSLLHQALSVRVVLLINTEELYMCTRSNVKGADCLKQKHKVRHQCFPAEGDHYFMQKYEHDV